MVKGEKLSIPISEGQHLSKPTCPKNDEGRKQMKNIPYVGLEVCDEINKACHLPCTWIGWSLSSQSRSVQSTSRLSKGYLGIYKGHDSRRGCVRDMTQGKCVNEET